MVADTSRKKICQTSLAPNPMDASDRMIKVLDIHAAPLAEGVAVEDVCWYRGEGLASEDAMIHRDVEASDWMTRRDATPSSRLNRGLEMRSSVCQQPGTRRASQKKNATEAETIRSSELNPVSDCKSCESSESSDAVA